LQYAQKRDLGLRRDIADLVQRDGPAVCPFKASQMPLSRSREGASLAYPNSSEAIKDGGIAAQFTRMNGRAALGERS
jgi:hypothetical protein